MTVPVFVKGREPAVWIGIIVSCVLAVLSVLTGQGVISEALAGTITDTANAFAQLAVIFSPLITALIIRPNTTSASQPSLPLGTPVLIKGAGDQPPPDAAVLPVNPPVEPRVPAYAGPVGG